MNRVEQMKKIQKEALELFTKKNIEIKIQDVNGAKVFELKQFVFHSSNVKFPIRLPAGIKGQLILTISVNGILTTQQVVIQ